MDNLKKLMRFFLTAMTAYIFSSVLIYGASLKEEAILKYNKRLADFNGSFSMLLLNDNDIPDMITVSSGGFTMVYVDGNISLLDGEGVGWLITDTGGGIQNRYSYYERKRFLKEHSTGVSDFDTYYVVYHSGKKYGITKKLHRDADSCRENSAVQYPTSYGYDPIRKVWIESKSISFSRYLSVVRKYSGGAGVKGCVFYKNTAANRNRYLFNNVPVLSFPKAELELTSEKKVKLKPNVYGPAGKLIWKSSDSSVVKVNSSGVLTPAKSGKATITVRSKGRTAKCKVTVVLPANKISISLTSSAELKVGESRVLKAIVRGTSKKVQWSTTNHSIISVNTNGKITAKKVGSAKIIAKIENVSVSCRVTVNPKHSDLTYYYGKSLSVIKRDFVGLSRCTDSVHGSNYWKYKKIYFLIQDNKCIRVNMEGSVKGYTIHGFYPTMTMKIQGLESKARKHNLRFFYKPIYGWIYKDQYNRYIVLYDDVISKDTIKIYRVEIKDYL